jgi:hypothetical protein
MKTERRHELQHNTLADMMADVGENAKPYAKAILGVLLAGIVVFGTYLYLSKRSEAEEATSWDLTWQALSSQDQAKQMELLREASDKYPDKQAGLWAQLTLADLELNRGVTLLFSERAIGMNQLSTAVEDYQAVEKRAQQPMIRQHALFGIGRAQESRNKLDEARSAYEELAKNYPSGPYANRAKMRLDDLARESTKGWYDWFNKTEPTSPSRSSTGGKGFDDFPLSEPDNFKPPASDSSGAGSKVNDKAGDTNAKPTSGATSLDKSSSKPTETKPGDKTTKPAEVKPAETKPDSKATDGKSTEAKPAEPKPTETTPANPKSDATKPAESKPAETSSPPKSSDVKSSDAKSSDAKSPDAKSSDAKATAPTK